MKIKSLFIIAGLLFSSFFYYQKALAALDPHSSAHCGPYTEKGPFDCAPNFTVRSFTPVWPRNVTYSGTAKYNCNNEGCNAIGCGDNNTVTTIFDAFNIDGRARALDLIVNWDCVNQSCTPTGECSCVDWQPAEPENDTCLAVTTIPAFSRSVSKKIENLPVSIRTNSDFMYCDSNCGAPSSDPDHPLPACDPRMSEGGAIGTGDHPTACDWEFRGYDNCNNKIADTSYTYGTEKMYTCEGYDIDAPDYDTLSYQFRLKEQNAPGQGVVVCSDGGADGTEWSVVGGGECKQNGPNSNQVIFRSSDSESRFKLTCQVSDNAGSIDIADTIIALSDTASCRQLKPDKFAACPGESVGISADTHPDPPNVETKWHWLQDLEKIDDTVWIPNKVSETMSFRNKHRGVNTITMDVRNTLNGEMVEDACQASISVLSANCEVVFRTGIDGGMAALLPGSRVEIDIKDHCLVGSKTYTAQILRDGASAVAGGNCTEATADYVFIDGDLSSSHMEIEACKAGTFKVEADVSVPIESVQCSNQMLVNTQGSQWWEIKPE